MTEVFEKWGRVISETAKDVTEKTGEVVEVVVEKTEKLYYKHKKGEEIDPQCVELCETIAERETTIEQLKAEIEKLREEI